MLLGGLVLLLFFLLMQNMCIFYTVFCQMGDVATIDMARALSLRGTTATFFLRRHS